VSNSGQLCNYIWLAKQCQTITRAGLPVLYSASTTKISNQLDHVVFVKPHRSHWPHVDGGRFFQ